MKNVILTNSLLTVNFGAFVRSLSRAARSLVSANSQVISATLFFYNSLNYNILADK